MFLRSSNPVYPAVKAILETAVQATRPEIAGRLVAIEVESFSPALQEGSGTFFSLPSETTAYLLGLCTFFGDRPAPLELHTATGRQVISVQEAESLGMRVDQGTIQFFFVKNMRSNQMFCFRWEGRRESRAFRACGVVREEEEYSC